MEQQKDVIFAVVETVNHPHSPQQTQPNSFHHLLLRVKVHSKVKLIKKKHWRKCFCFNVRASEFVDSVTFQFVWRNRSGKRARVRDDDFPFRICPLLWGHDVPATLRCLYGPSQALKHNPTHWPPNISWGQSSPAPYRKAQFGPWPPIVYIQSVLCMLLW